MQSLECVTLDKAPKLKFVTHKEALVGMRTRHWSYHTTWDRAECSFSQPTPTKTAVTKRERLRFLRSKSRRPVSTDTLIKNNCTISLLDPTSTMPSNATLTFLFFLIYRVLSLLSVDQSVLSIRCLSQNLNWGLSLSLTHCCFGPL